jgi:glycosyltransferase involved in cell wall biosynthesis
MDYQIGFIVEQALGHITHSRNLIQNVANDPTIRAHWGLPTFETTGLAARLPLYRSNWTLRAGLQTRRLLADMQRRERLEALFFHTQVTATLAQDWLERIPSIVSLDATPRQYDELGFAYAHRAGPDWLERWKWRLNRNCFQKARCLVTWSAWAKDGLIADYGVPQERITVIPPGVTVSEWDPPTAKPPTDTIRILFVGGDLDRKGGWTLLEAYRRLRAELIPAALATSFAVELHMVTRGQISEEPGVFVYNKIEPNTPELKNLYFNSDIFCLPTVGDCLPMVLAEAGASGLPLVSTSIGAIPEIVQDGQTGFLVPSGDVEALTAILRRLVCNADLRQALGRQAAQLVRRKHDAASNATQLLYLLKTMAAENRQKNRD